VADAAQRLRSRPEEVDSRAEYSVAASELIAGAGHAVGTEPQALAWFVAR